VRSHLHPSLQNLSNPQLLEMFEWEFQRLPLFHNAPVDARGVDDPDTPVHDDSPLNITLNNGFIQNPCERYVYGGPEELFSVVMYSHFYADRYGLDPAARARPQGAADHWCD
jgi:hypothetical protein